MRYVSGSSRALRRGLQVRWRSTEQPPILGSERKKEWNHQAPNNLQSLVITRPGSRDVHGNPIPILNGNPMGRPWLEAKARASGNEREPARLFPLASDNSLDRPIHRSTRLRLRASRSERNLQRHVIFTPSPIDRETGCCFRSISLFISLFVCLFVRPPGTVVSDGLMFYPWCYLFRPPGTTVPDGLTFCRRCFFLFRHGCSELPRPIALKLCQVVGIWLNFINWLQKFGGRSPKKIGGPKTCKISVNFGPLQTLIANISGTTQDIHKRKT